MNTWMLTYAAKRTRKRLGRIFARGGSLSCPAMIINDKILINGFRKDKIKEALGI